MRKLLLPLLALASITVTAQVKEKKLKAQPVRIKYVKFPDSILAQVGIDIYGAHFLWTIDRRYNWDVINVERLWVY